MSKEKFTQGEWLLKDGYQVGIKVSFGDGFFTLASCQVFNEGKANAHLISAAPDMFECLLIAVGSIKEICHVRGVTLPNSTIKRCEKALAKARGEL